MRDLVLVNEIESEIERRSQGVMDLAKNESGLDSGKQARDVGDELICPGPVIRRLRTGGFSGRAGFRAYKARPGGR